MNIKNITCKEKIPFDELIVGRHYYFVLNTNYVRMEIINVNKKKDTVIARVITRVSPLRNVDCKIKRIFFEASIYPIYTQDTKEYLEIQESRMEDKKEAEKISLPPAI